MNSNYENDFFKEIAYRYVESYGHELQQELEQMKQQNISCVTPALDIRMHRWFHICKTKRFAMRITALAACLLMLFLTPSFLRYYQHSGITPAPSPNSATIPISFTLPTNLSVSSGEQDHNQSVYRLHDLFQDDVVMVLEETNLQIVTEDLIPIKINGSQVYAQATGDYNFLIFKKDGILYTLTCQYDINTLVDLGKNIL